jgi:hypothetical protein
MLACFLSLTANKIIWHITLKTSVSIFAITILQRYITIMTFSSGKAENKLHFQHQLISQTVSSSTVLKLWIPLYRCRSHYKIMHITFCAIIISMLGEFSFISNKLTKSWIICFNMHTKCYVLSYMVATMTLNWMVLWIIC